MRLGCRPGRTPALVAIAAFALSPAAADAAGAKFRYVSPRGKDKTKCTQRAPCRTIARAVARAHRGDTIQVGKGTYREDVVIPNPCPSSRPTGQR
ncbi:MAG TPA: DUF1565 domain-containing protein [Solirubrobacteraceae bacterium]|nr:DUF1565 domain-containing protein [Solirubrobacteraceae bacterium]